MTVPPIPALAPNAMCAVPRIFSSSRMLPVSVARSFVPMPSSARLRPSGPWASSVREERARRSRPVALAEAAVAHGQQDRLVDEAAMPATSPRSCPRRPTGETKPSPHGRLPKAPGAVRSPVVGDRRCGRVRSKRMSVPRGAGHVGVVGVGQQPCDGVAARAHRVEVGAHEPREQVGVDARHRRAAGAGLARALARASCARATAGRAR